MTADAWRDRAACRGASTATFYPERGETTLPAKAICDGCPVQLECLEAGVPELFGVWGRTSERDRRKLRRERGVTVECDRCGAAFQVPRRRAVNLCSDECRDAARAETRARSASDETRRYPRRCAVCDRPFLARQPTTILCGDKTSACFREHRRRQESERAAS